MELQKGCQKEKSYEIDRSLFRLIFTDSSCTFKN